MLKFVAQCLTFCSIKNHLIDKNVIVFIPWIKKKKNPKNTGVHSFWLMKIIRNNAWFSCYFISQITKEAILFPASFWYEFYFHSLQHTFSWHVFLWRESPVKCVMVVSAESGSQSFIIKQFLKIVKFKYIRIHIHVYCVNK